METRPIKSGLAVLIGQLEEREGRAYTIEEIARGAGINRQTAKSWLDDKVQGLNFGTLTGLLTYLRRRGLVEVGISDLLIEATKAQE